MRYMNWDILLFPEGSKIPQQEFKTGCYITQEPDLGPDQNIFPLGAASNLNATPRYMPTVTSFIPNLPLGSPLKVSIHSWEPPVASADARESVKESGQIYFEARVLIDGICVAGILFDQQPPWPQVIDSCSYPGKDGIAQPLTFPAFHSEIITQNYWNAGENVGRIKIVIAEGIVRHQGSPFEKTRSIVCFSFQHAPSRVLEESGIAYPNPGMLHQLQNHIFGSISARAREPDPDAHGHSIRQQGVLPTSLQSRLAIAPSFAYPNFAASPPRTRGWQLEDPCWSPIPSEYDAYLSRQWPHAPSSSGDISMPDYSHSLTPASSRNHSNHSNHQDPQFPVGLLISNTAVCEELDNSPNRPSSSGTIPPANTRVSSAANTPPTATRPKPSAAAEARASSYSHVQGRSVSVTTRDPPPSEVREPSNVSVQLLFPSRPESQVEGSEKSEPRIKRKPAKEVMGKKEGKANELGLGAQIQKKLSTELLERQNKENIPGSADIPIVLSDSKRKRSTNQPFDATRAADTITPTQSPVRKLSKGDNLRDQDLDDLTPDGVMSRTPLANMSNMP